MTDTDPTHFEAAARDFIASMMWDEATPIRERALVISNIHGFAGFLARRSASSIAPLLRREIKEVLDLTHEVEAAVKALPYLAAKPQIDSLQAIRETVAGTLPGGLAGGCEGCGKLIGANEVAGIVEDGGELCAPCVSDWKDSQAKASVEGPADAGA